MSKLMVVVGATGNQGSSVAKTFSKVPGWKVRGITRDPSKASAKEFAKEFGVDFVAADLDDKPSLIKAFSGASAIFGVTDFWQFPQNPASAELAKKEGIKHNEACERLEVAQFKNIIDAAAEVLASEGKLERLVMSTLSDTLKWSKGTITENRHFDGKAKGTKYLKESTDAKHKALVAVTSWLQVGIYLDNWKNPILPGPQEQEDGSVRWVAMAANHDATLVPFVHPPTDTGPFVKALVLDAPAGTTLLGTSGELSQDDFAKLVSKQLGKDIDSVEVTREELIRKVGPDFGEELYASSSYFAEFGYDGGDPDVKRPKDLGIGTEGLTTPEKYVETTDWSIVWLKNRKN